MDREFNNSVRSYMIFIVIMREKHIISPSQGGFVGMPIYIICQLKILILW